MRFQSNKGKDSVTYVRMPISAARWLAGSMPARASSTLALLHIQRANGWPGTLNPKRESDHIGHPSWHVAGLPLSSTELSPEER
jgi:hypothetical protein